MGKTLSLLVAVSTVTLCSGEASAQIYVGGGISVGGGIAVGGYVSAPPVVVYEYAPPPMVYVAAPPPVVVVRPAPPPLAPPPLALAPLPEFRSEVGVGVRVNGGVTGSAGTGMGGGGVFLRLHSFRNLAFELALDVYAGDGYAGAMREEIPATLSALWFLGRPTQALRLFLLTGVGVAWAHVGEGERTDEPVYVGGVAGVGVEWRLMDWMAIEADVRGFLRQRVNDIPDNPAYVTDPMWNDGNCNEIDGCTDLQGGGTFHLGAILYF